MSRVCPQERFSSLAPGFLVRFLFFNTVPHTATRSESLLLSDCTWERPAACTISFPNPVGPRAFCRVTGVSLGFRRFSFSWVPIPRHIPTFAPWPPCFLYANPRLRHSDSGQTARSNRVVLSTVRLNSNSPSGPPSRLASSFL